MFREFAKTSMLKISLLASLLLLGWAHVAGAAEIRVEAVPGTPFGVGRAIIPIDGILDRESLETHFFSVHDRDGRVHYPAVRYMQPMGVIRELFDIPVEDSPQPAADPFSVYWIPASASHLVYPESALGDRCPERKTTSVSPALTNLVGPL